jgi:hypothetical protein
MREEKAPESPHKRDPMLAQVNGPSRKGLGSSWDHHATPAFISPVTSLGRWVRLFPLHLPTVGIGTIFEENSGEQKQSRKTKSSGMDLLIHGGPHCCYKASTTAIGPQGTAPRLTAHSLPSATLGHNCWPAQNWVPNMIFRPTMQHSCSLGSFLTSYHSYPYNDLPARWLLTKGHF